MSNSLSILNGYVHALFNDIAYAYSKPSDYERDKKRLLHEVHHHGVEILAVVLPSIAKHFDKCLSRGQYTSSNLPLTRFVNRRIQVPSFMKDLYLKVFDSDGLLREDPDVNVILAIRQILKGLSKVKLQCRKDRISNEVVNFIDIESSLESPSLSWDKDWLSSDSNYRCWLDLHFADFFKSSSNGNHKTRMSDSRTNLESLPRLEFCYATTLQRVADIVVSSLGDFYNECCEVTGERLLPKHGRGRVSNLRRGESKFSFAEWPDKLELVFPRDIYSVYDCGLEPDNPRVRHLPGDTASPSKLIAVPKTLKGPRLIASEPNQNQWIQQLMWLQIKSKVKKNKFLNPVIKFESQEQNAFMALNSSSSGSHATIDLSSASDRFSLKLLERMFRSNPTFLERFHACRTAAIKNGIDDKFDTLVLKKAFSQGNALTFPIQSIGYTIICIAAVLIQRNLDPTSRNIVKVASEVSVYGDDMIVPIDGFEMTYSLLETLGFKVNPDKTFHVGKFRESCGIDAYDGVDVTPTYVKIIAASPNHENAEAAISASNNLLLNGWWHLAKFQESLVKRFVSKLPYIAPHDQNLGLKSFSGRATSHLRKRYSTDLQKYEYQVYNLVSKTKLKDHELGTSHFLQWLVERPAIDLDWSSGVVDTSSAVMQRGWSTLERKPSRAVTDLMP